MYKIIFGCSFDKRIAKEIILKNKIDVVNENGYSMVVNRRVDPSKLHFNCVDVIFTSNAWVPQKNNDLDF